MVNPFGFFLLALGLIAVAWPYEVARFEERLDAIGSKRSWSEVEPADWRVLLTRGIGVLFVLVGGGLFLFG
ncbi:hypothetical protein [Salinarchaeum laminariae]|uniref:hypothetical protein n=1 Tax=Salinarchaeum laminariae TaxID=869888 RepID=UPI0020BDC918|nr:hypothetical protein [Salinarchaeum laminariae]